LAVKDDYNFDFIEMGLEHSELLPSPDEIAAIIGELRRRI